MPELDMPYSPADLEHAKQLFSSGLYAVVFQDVIKNNDPIAEKMEAIHCHLLDGGWEVCSRCRRFQPIAAVVEGEKPRCSDCVTDAD